VAEIYPMGASNQTYSFLPAASSSGTSTPQSKSRVMERGCRPDFNQDWHWPNTFDFNTPFFPSFNQLSNQGCYLSNGRYQCLVSRNTGVLPLKVDFGLIRSVGFSEVPHFSH